MQPTSATSTGTISNATLVKASWCAFYAAGIIGCLVGYGLLQERIMSQPYGEPPEKFRDSVFLVLCNRFVAVVFSVCMVVVQGEAFVNKAPLWKYIAISFSNVYASTCQYEALKYVSFPVQMLGKSFKMMPVMLWGMVISGKEYKRHDWLVALAVTGGVVEFLMTGPIQSDTGTGSSMHGLMYLGAFLALDGFTSTYQEKLFKEHTTSKYNQMLYINLGSSIISTITLICSTGFGSPIGFGVAHPQFVFDAMQLSIAAVAGQWFIYSQVKEFGALVFAATMNVRQVTSILVSYATYGHFITPLQIFGLMAVFAALFYKSYLGIVGPSDDKEKKPLLLSKSGKPLSEHAEPTCLTEGSFANGKAEV